MAEHNNSSFNNNSSILKEPGSNKSFVKKVRSRVSGLLPSSLSKWFGNDDNNKAVTRQREEDIDDECYEIQPPSKRAKIPSPTNIHNNLRMNSVANTLNINDTSRIHNTTSGDKQNNFRSTFLEPTAGPSGIKSRKLFSPSVPIHYNSSENLVNGDKDSDSGESTSGYSSMARISHKDVASSGDLKKCDGATPNINPNNLFNSSAFGGHSRSLFTERSLSPQINSSLSSRRPSFNASTFGSPNFIDRTLSTKRIINSPFYNGRTTYGGAAAYGLQQNKSSRGNRASMRNQVEVKPVNQSVTNDNMALSKTARRILDTLEQYTTPVSDAKKIPNPSLKRPRPEGLLSKYTSANPYLMREHKVSASNHELQIPTVPDLLKMKLKLKERLQDSTVAVRQIAATSKLALNSDEYKIRTVEEETPKHTNKIKNKVTSIRQKPDNEMVEELKLPDAPLPITTLPKFDFSLPLPTSCSKPLITVPCNESTKPEPKVPKDSQKPADSTSVQVKSSSEADEYTFANPLVLAENLISIIAINDFKFSDPVCKQGKTEVKSPMVNFKSPDIPNKFKPSDFINNFKDSPNLGVKRKSSGQSAELVPQLLSGSVDDFLKKDKPEVSSSLMDKFKPALGTWECSDCMLRNLPDKLKCAACEAPRNKPETKKEPVAKTGFGSEFKMSVDKWECSACLVRNASADIKCVACTTPKPSKPNGPIAPLAPINSFGDKFKPSSSTWECPTCMIRNKDEIDKCVACETSKPGSTKKSVVGFGDGFKKHNEWECGVCMIRNPVEKTMCMACETPRPGVTIKKDLPKNQPTVQSFNFGILPTTSDKPKPEPTENSSAKNETDSAAIATIFGNPANVTTTTITTTSTTTVPTFSFGIPAPAKSATENTIKADEPPKEPPKPKKLENVPTPTGFVFGNSSLNCIKQPLPLPKLEEKATLPTIPPVNFNFGNNLQVKPPDKVEPVAVVSSSQQVPQLTEDLKKPVSSVAAFTFGTSAPTLKRPMGDNKMLGTAAKKDAPAPSPSPASIIFSPLNQPNKPETNLNKSVLPSLNGNPNNKIDKNLFGTLGTVGQNIPNSSFTFSPSKVQPVLPATSANTNLFNFGAKTTSVPIFGNPKSETPVFKFNVNTPEQPSLSNQPSFNMNANIPPITSNVFGGGNNTTSGFGAPSKPAFETPRKPVFEAPNKPVFEAPSKPVFETPTIGHGPPPAFGSLTTGFGASTATSEIKPFSFGPRANENPPPAKTTAFSFGQTAKPPEPTKTPAFSFGSAAPPSAPNSGFSFNTNPAVPAPNVNFNFSATKVDNSSPFQSPAPAPSIFGTPAQVHAQQQQPQPVQNGGFNFGSTAGNNNVKTGFNFGVAPTPQFNAPQASSGPAVFSFGPANPNPVPPATGGFNFGAGPAAPPPAFNANAKPTFNFTGGTTPTFSAQPSVESPMMAQRKKIRAVRRSQR